MKQNLQLVQFQSTDHLWLPGLLYEPVRRTRKAAIFLHGNGSASVFYSSIRMNAYARALNSAGIAFLPFNNRGAHYIKKLKKSLKTGSKYLKLGTAYERIKDCIKDIDGAVAYLRSLGYNEFYLIGESTGANKICVYNFHKPRNRIAKYVLLGGGDDTGIYYSQWGPRKFAAILERSRQKGREGRGEELVPSSQMSGSLMSYRSLYDTINPDGDYNTFPFLEALEGIKLSRKKLFRHFASIRKPILAVYGSEDQFCYGRVPDCVEILKRHANPRAKLAAKIIEGAGHSFGHYEEKLARLVASWLTKK